MRRRQHRRFPMAGVLVVSAAVWLAGVQGGWALLAPAAIQQQVAEAVARELNISQESQVEQNLQVLAPFRSLPSGAAVQVISIKPGLTPGSWLVRLDCASRRDCLPFDAVLRIPGAGGALSTKPSPETHKAALQAPALGKRLLAPPLTRRGDRAELVAELPGIRLQTQVICLESGALGDQIQVQTLETHRILTATVAGEDLVKVAR
ncbi:MAG TPA: flagella basal body P-ring formation protein FlgA [Terriglobales bacterium]|nr:flagella basal body P-ring formation protein FlgA [Terriglobales bacterium]